MLLHRSTLLSAALLCAATLSAFAQDGVTPEASISKALLSPDLKGTLVARTTKEVWTGKDGQSRLTVYTIGDYELRLVQFAEGSGFGVFQDGHRKIAALSEPGTSPAELLFEPTLGLDVDQDGAPDAVLGWNTGGMHCCYVYQVFSFADPFRGNLTIDAGDAPLELASGNSPQVVLHGTDSVLGYWHSDYASGIFSDVYLQVKGDKVSFAEAWMKYPPSDEELAKMKAESAAAFASKENWIQSPENGEPPYAPRVLMQHVVKLIYTGNGAQALALLKDTWKGDAAKPKAIATDLLSQLTNSQYWEGIKLMNGWTGEPAAIVQAGLAAK